MSALTMLLLDHAAPAVSLPSGLTGAKLHTSTVALVPPEACWPSIQSARLQLKDKGLFRWPPHINLLYPFIPTDEFGAAAPLLADALRAIQPFDLTLDALDTFGGRHRGVLYLRSSSMDEEEKLRAMQAALQGALPFCSEQQKRGIFVPHLTVSHFKSREDAEAAKCELQRDWQPVTFSTEGCLHILRRVGGGGQFERACTLRFGGSGPSPLFFDPPERFDAMPQQEEEWMRQARKDAYKRGGASSSGRRKSRGRPRRTPEERAAILARTPEDIAAIRAERAVKRARLQAEAEAATARPAPET